MYDHVCILDTFYVCARHMHMHELKACKTICKAHVYRYIIRYMKNDFHNTNKVGHDSPEWLGI